MNEIWIVNASPIITLAKAGHLDLFYQLVGEVFVPNAVMSEIQSGPTTDPARQAIESGWGKSLTVKSIPNSIAQENLGAGESAVLAAALIHQSSYVVLDDAKARSCAKKLGLSTMGTLGIVLRAKNRGLISSASNLLKQLQSSGLHINNRIVQEALIIVNEGWDM